MAATRSRLWLLSIALIIVGASSCSSVSAPEVRNFDKVAHFFVFGLLATHLHLSGLTRGKLWLTVLVCSLFGFIDEWHQSFTPGRSVDWTDWVSDTLGALTATLCLTRWYLYRHILLFRLL